MSMKSDDFLWLTEETSPVFLEKLLDESLLKRIQSFRREHGIPTNGFHALGPKAHSWVRTQLKKIKAQGYVSPFTGKKLSRNDCLMVHKLWFIILVDPAFVFGELSRGLFIQSPHNHPYYQTLLQFIKANKLDELQIMDWHSLIFWGIEGMNIAPRLQKQGLIGLKKRKLDDRDVVSLDLKFDMDVDKDLIPWLRKNKSLVKRFVTDADLPRLPKPRQRVKNFLVCYYAKRRQTNNEIAESLWNNHRIKVTESTIRQIKSRYYLRRKM